MKIVPTLFKKRMDFKMYSIYMFRVFAIAELKLEIVE